jgi:high-affinity nickel-transport protein
MVFSSAAQATSGVGLLAIVGALGMRHGVDPDHLSAIDGLSRFHPSRWNGVFFALGHCAVVMLLAVGFGKAISTTVEPWQDWILVAVGLANLFRLVRPARHHHHVPPGLRASPLMLGVIFGMGFETASQISALLLAGQMNPWVAGAVFSLGMIVVDGTDGWLAARTQLLASGVNARALRAGQASRWLSVVVIVFSFSIAAADFARVDIDRFALPMGLTMFLVVVGLRLWAARTPRTVAAEA